MTVLRVVKERADTIDWLFRRRKPLDELPFADLLVHEKPFQYDEVVDLIHQLDRVVGTVTKDYEERTILYKNNSSYLVPKEKISLEDFTFSDGLRQILGAQDFKLQFDYRDSDTRAIRLQGSGMNGELMSKLEETQQFYIHYARKVER